MIFATFVLFMFRHIISYFLLFIFLQSVALFPVSNFGNVISDGNINSLLELIWETGLGNGDNAEADLEENLPVGSEEEVKCDCISGPGSLAPIPRDLLSRAFPYHDESLIQNWLETIGWPPEFLS